MDMVGGRWRVVAMSDRPVRIVYARPPSKRPEAKASHRVAALTEGATAVLTSSAAIAAFLDLLAAWKLAPARGWRMLTGLGYRAGSLTPEQIAKVQHLVAVDADMRSIRGDSVGEWMVTGNGAAVLAGSAPVDFLTRAGTPGYAALARQVRIWARL